MGRASNQTQELIYKRGRRRLAQSQQHTLLSQTPAPEALGPLEAALLDIRAGKTESAQKLLGRYRGYLGQHYEHLDRLSDAALDKLVGDNGGETITGYARRRLMMLAVEPATDRMVAFKSNHGTASNARPRVMHLRAPGTSGKFTAVCGASFFPNYVRRGMWDAVETGLGVDSEDDKETLELFRRCKRCELKEAGSGYQSTQIRFNALDREELQRVRLAALHRFIDASGNLLSVAGATQDGMREGLADVAAGRLAEKDGRWWVTSYCSDSTLSLKSFFRHVYSDLALMPAPAAADLAEVLAQLPLPSTSYELLTPGHQEHMRRLEVDRVVLPKLLASTWPDVLEIIAREVVFDDAYVLPFRDPELRQKVCEELRQLVQDAGVHGSGPALSVRLMPGVGRWEIYDRLHKTRTSQHMEREAALSLARFELRRRPYGGRLYFEEAGGVTFEEIEHDPAA